MFWFSGTFLKTTENIGSRKTISRNLIFNKTEIFFTRTEKFVGVLVIKQIGLPLVDHAYDYRPDPRGPHSDTTSDVAVRGNVDSRVFMLEWSMPFVMSCFVFF